MIRRILYIVSAILIIASCKNEETPGYERNPAVELSFDSFYKDGMYVSIRSINTDAVYIMAAKATVPAPSAEKIVEDGIKAEGSRCFVGGLEEETEYAVYGVGVLGNTLGKTHSYTIITPKVSDDEAERENIPTFADLDLLPGGHSNKTP